MYIAPRPRVEDDPFFAVRLSVVAVVSVIATLLFQSPMPVLLPALSVGLMGGIRKGYDLKKALGGPVALIVTMSVLSFLVGILHTMPVLLLLILLTISSLAYYSILSTGNPAAMLLLIGVVLMSALGANSVPAMEVMRDGFIEASIFALLIIPLAYGLIPPKNHEPLEEKYVSDTKGHHWKRAFIRTFVLFVLSLWLYTVLDSSNILLAIAAVFVLIFPTQETLFNEAKERVLASILGGVVALGILAVTSIVGHVSILLILIALGGIFFGNKMVYGQHPAMVYQFAFTTMLVLVVGGLSTQEPISATSLRVCLTLVGAVVAAVITAAMETLLKPIASYRQIV